MKEKIDLPLKVQLLLHILQESGESAFVVGGCVRDAIRGETPHDWDVCTSAKPETIIKLFQSNGYKIVPTGLKHGTVTVLVDEESFEITTFRIDGPYCDGRHPSSIVFTKDLEKDLSRRDFTMNAIAYSPADGFIDPYHGIQDIGMGKIRCVGDARQRFSEDVLRVMRAVRFNATFGFAIENATEMAIHEFIPLLDKISKERIRDELLKMLPGRYIGRTLVHYQNLITQIIPEIQPCIGFEQHNPYHIYDVWHHTVESVDVADNNAYLRMVLLLHDIGKPYCYQEDDNHIGHFHGHGAVSAKLAQTILNRLRFSNHEVAWMTQLIAEHDRFITPNEKSVRTLLNKIGEEQFERLLKIRSADVQAQAPEFERQRLDKIANLKAIKSRILEKQECISLRDLSLNGDDLIRLGYKPGPQLGEMLYKMLNLVLEDPSKNKRETLLAFANCSLNKSPST